jgi:hypothetical protein
LKQQISNTYQPSSLLLLSLPKSGVLYLSDGGCDAKDVLPLSSKIPRNSAGTYSVKYRPTANKHSKR